jgi:hypothetical protein
MQYLTSNQIEMYSEIQFVIVETAAGRGGIVIGGRGGMVMRGSAVSAG